MACAKSLISQEDFACSICLNMFDKPVSIPCGHNFCHKCISDFWNSRNGLCSCPLCKYEYEMRPALTVNTLIAQMVEKVKIQEPSAVQVLDNGSVPCGVCSGEVAAAVNSCLHCSESYCERHLEPHKNKAILKKHKLVAPVEDLDSRICKEHEQILLFICQQDKMFLCELCKKSDDHKKHQIVTLEEEVAAQMNYLTSEKEATHLMLEERQRALCKIQNDLTRQRHEAERELSYSVAVLTTLIDYIRRSKDELIKVTETYMNEEKKTASYFNSQLEAEIVQIQQRKDQLDVASVVRDCYLFLENIFRGTITPLDVKDWSAFTLDTALPSTHGVVNMLKITVMKEIQVLCDPDLREMQQHAVNLTLDPDTADPSLLVSGDRKKVSYQIRKNDLIDTPERFAGVPNILAKEGFSEGKFYYETQVKDKTQWLLGVVNQSINRKGDIRVNPSSGYWTVYMKNGELIGNDGSAVKLHVRRIPNKVGVFVDYEEGCVSFYDVDIRSQLFSFTGCVFREKLFPIFNPGTGNRGKNLAPLIITHQK